MESFTLLCKVHSGVTLSYQISLNIAVFIDHGYIIRLAHPPMHPPKQTHTHTHTCTHTHNTHTLLYYNQQTIFVKTPPDPDHNVSMYSLI